MFKIDLKKERFKFSASHFTIFSEDMAERLHGHNYQLGVSIWMKDISKSNGLAFPFSEAKETIDSICKSLDEYILVPMNSPFLKVTETESQIDFVFNKKLYSFPKEDCRLLNLTNISSEELARYICLDFSKLTNISFEKIEISVQESSGQSVSYTYSK